MKSWPKKRITVDEFHAIPDDSPEWLDARVELIDGEIIDMSPIGTRHFIPLNWLNRQLILAVGDRAIVHNQGPLRLSQWDEPVPDFVLLKPRADLYLNQFPGAPDALLVIEVSDTSLLKDRKTKAALYARRGVAEYWIVNIPDRQLHIHRAPAEGGYREITSTSAPGVTPLPLAGDPVTIDLTGLLSLW